jgi:hypothetical protein
LQESAITGSRTSRNIHGGLILGAESLILLVEVHPLDLTSVMVLLVLVPPPFFVATDGWLYFPQLLKDFLIPLVYLVHLVPSVAHI